MPGFWELREEAEKYRRCLGFWAETTDTRSAPMDFEQSPNLERRGERQKNIDSWYHHLSRKQTQPHLRESLNKAEVGKAERRQKNMNLPDWVLSRQTDIGQMIKNFEQSPDLQPREEAEKHDPTRFWFLSRENRHYLGSCEIWTRLELWKPREEPEKHHLFALCFEQRTKAFAPDVTISSKYWLKRVEKKQKHMHLFPGCFEQRSHDRLMLCFLSWQTDMY